MKKLKINQQIKQAMKGGSFVHKVILIALAPFLIVGSILKGFYIVGIRFSKLLAYYAGFSVTIKGLDTKYKLKRIKPLIIKRKINGNTVFHKKRKALLFTDEIAGTEISHYLAVSFIRGSKVAKIKTDR